jgi:hypothetical protein
MRSLRLALLVAGLLALSAPAAASARDSHAPAGARGDWLPSAEWVMSSWLPYDEATLERVLGTSRPELATWLDDRRTLGALARRRGHRDLRELAARLVDARADHPRGARRRMLERRARDTLTQAHLARHVLFHVFHSPALATAAPRLFGMSAAGYRRLRDRGLSPRSIAARGGRSQDELRAALGRLFAQRARRAVRAGAMSARQAARLRAEQAAGTQAFIARPYRTTAQQQQYAALECHLPAVH